MIVAKRKPFDEIKELLKPYKKVLNVGCGTCVSVCLAGGEKEVAVLNAEIEMARKLDDDPIEIGAHTIQSLIHISEPTRQVLVSRMPSSA